MNKKKVGYFIVDCASQRRYHFYKFSTKTSAIRLWKIILNVKLLHFIFTHHWLLQYVNPPHLPVHFWIFKLQWKFGDKTNMWFRSKSKLLPIAVNILIVNKNLPNSWARALCLSYKWTLLTPRSCYLNTELWLVSWLSLVDNTDLSLVQKSLVHKSFRGELLDN